MRIPLNTGLNRREFISRSILAGTALYLCLGNNTSLAAIEQPPETTKLRMLKWPTACWVPQYVAEPLLREEGFTDITYVEGQGKYVEVLSSGEIDINLSFSAVEIFLLDKFGHKVKILSGLHPGCYALIGSDRINSVRDLKGKTVWAGSNKGGGPHTFFSTIVAYIGLDPHKDIKYAWIPKSEAIELFKQGKIDAFMSFPPEPQELMDKNIGKVLVDTNVDRPWSQYFCCVISGNRDFIARNPVATKRALRAILKANDLVAQNPERAADELIKRQIRNESERKYIIQALRDTPYDRWREYNPEDTVRFYALRLREIGMIKSSPEEFMANNTDWTFIASLKNELGMEW